MDIFSNKDFLKEREKFYLIYHMLSSKEKLFLTDNNNYLLARSNKGYPTWIWSKDNIKKDKLKEIIQLIKDNYLPEEYNSFTCKEELYNLLKEHLEVSDYFKMGFLKCDSLNEIKKVEGFLDKINYSDKITLAKYWQDNCKELHNEEVTMTEALEEVSNWLDNKSFYVWRNKDGKAVSMAGYGIEEDMAKITHVFTPKDKRGKGYCTNLIYFLTEKLLKENLIPVLYTDYNYIPSNHTYKKVGYKDQGYLINFKIKKG